MLNTTSFINFLRTVQPILHSYITLLKSDNHFLSFPNTWWYALAYQITISSWFFLAYDLICHHWSFIVLFHHSNLIIHGFNIIKYFLRLFYLFFVIEIHLLWYFLNVLSASYIIIHVEETRTHWRWVINYKDAEIMFYEIK